MAEETTINDLAAMVKKGFDETARNIKNVETEMREGFAKVDERFVGIDERFVGIDGRIDNINSRLFVIERDIAEIRSHFVYRHEFEDLMARVKCVEVKLGVESGK